MRHIAGETGPDASRTANDAPTAHRPAADETPRALVVLAASLGGVTAIGDVLAGLPADLPAAILVVQHRSQRGPSLLAQVLSRRTRLIVKDAEPGERIRAGVVYLAPSARHLLVHSDGTLATTDGRRIRYLLSSANPLLESAASAFGASVIAVVLTGSGMDATDGVQAVKARGGFVITQDPATSACRRMPAAAIATGVVDLVLPLEAIAPELCARVAAMAAPPDASR